MTIVQERDHCPESASITHELTTHQSLRKRTPLPVFSLLILFLIQLAEPVAASVIYPFVNQLVRETGVTHGDEAKTGFFAGIIVRRSFLSS